MGTIGFQIWVLTEPQVSTRQPQASACKSCTRPTSASAAQYAAQSYELRPCWCWSMWTTDVAPDPSQQSLVNFSLFEMSFIVNSALYVHSLKFPLLSKLWKKTLLRAQAAFSWATKLQTLRVPSKDRSNELIRKMTDFC